MSKLIFDTLKSLSETAKKTRFYLAQKDTAKRRTANIVDFFVNGSITNDRGASFMSTGEERKLFNGRNTGLLIDGYKKRINEELSFKHVAIIAKTGVGKTQNFIKPNILTLADSNNSILVTDPSGELYADTSAYMASQGYRVLKLDPVNISESVGFNPLANIKSEIELSNIAQTLIASTTSLKGEGLTWATGATSRIEFLIKCLSNAPRKYNNLFNLQYLLQNFDSAGENLGPLMAKLANTSTLEAKWKEFISVGNVRTNDSYVSLAVNALSKLNEDTARLTMKNTFEFESFRKEKTILYLTFPSQHLDHYAYLLNLFYMQFFESCMRHLPAESDLPVFVLYDEFGHSSIPHFDSIITTIRKYGVSLAVVLQSISQLEQRYGREASETILEGGIGSKLFYAGADYNTAQFVAKNLGTVIRDEVHKGLSGTTTTTREFNLLNPDEITRLDDNEAIFLTENKKPIRLKTVPCYENAFLSCKLAGPLPCSGSNLDSEPLEYIPLD